MANVPSDQCLYPHFKSAVGYVLNPFMKQGTIWGLPDHPYAINSWGMRGGEIAEKRPGRKRIVLLGDSWFFGWRSKDEDRLESHLRRVLKDAAYEVVTVALPGWNVRSEAAFLRSHMRVLDPDAVIWEIAANDNWQLGGVIPPGSLSMAFSPQSRDLEANAWTELHNPLPFMPFVVDRYLENLALMDEVRTRYGITVLAVPVDMAPAGWAFLARKGGGALPTLFTPLVFAGDRRGRLSDTDRHPTPWMNERTALGYVAKLAEMGVVPRPALDTDQEAIVREWDRVNAPPVSEEEVEAYVTGLMQEVPAAYTGEEDLPRVAAGVDEAGSMGRHGLLYLRVPAARTAITLELDVDRYAPRYAREVNVTARTFERGQTAATTTFTGAAQRVTCRVPLPSTATRYPVYEVEWLFNYDECTDPTRCTAARLARVRSE